MDECQNDEHDCDVNAQCNNMFGSFNCTCLQGYSGDGVNCFGKAAFVVCYTLFDACFRYKKKLNQVLLHESNNI